MSILLQVMATSVSDSMICKLPLKYLLKCTSTNVVKVADAIELNLTDISFQLSIAGLFLSELNTVDIP